MHDIDRTQSEFEPEQDASELTEEMDGLELTEELDGGELEGEPYGGELEAGEPFGGEIETGEIDSGEIDAGEVDSGEFESPFTDSEEAALATELLGISSDAELDQFLGKVFKRAWRGVRKVGSRLGRVFRPLGGMLKGVAKKLLPLAGRAAGTFFGGPVGGALGSKLGAMAGSALEQELEGMGVEDREFEVARRVVRVAGAAAKQAVSGPPTGSPRADARVAVIGALKRHVPRLRIAGTGGASRYGVRGRTGRWLRRGSKIILFNV